MTYDLVQENIRFVDETNKLVLDPLKIESEFDSSGQAVVKIINGGDTTFSNLGIYVQPTSNLGPWDNPAEQPPQSDYQDLLTWGTRANATFGTPEFKKGGIKLFIDAYEEDYVYITRTSGSMFSNRIKIGSIPAGFTTILKLEFEVPEEVDARRLFISVVVG
tara:strand:+ start:341 stop:826 length:486 start_codon:yes stop_codon:yes gene_type:complete